jgi:acetate---CoA ligase (ADP-forming)
VTRDPVTALLDPRSVAVVGASRDPLKRGYQAIRRLLADGFPHPIYPVNPREREILSLPAYPSLAAVKDQVDLALVVTPAATVPDVLAECAASGVHAAVVIAVGFGETGAAGRELEERVAGIATQAGIALVGPNTNGVFNLPRRLNLVGAGDIPVGTLALVCQSGNMALSLFTQAAHETELGFSVYVGIGNEAGVHFDAVLPYLQKDPHTEAVLLYAEGFRDGRAFLRAARSLAAAKPLVVYKAGRSEAARRAALSHTGAITGSARVARALLRQAGAHVVERSDELVPVTETLVTQPSLSSPRVAVLADGGGHATVAADALSAYGLTLPALDDASTHRLRELLPPAASTRNPVDVAGATDRDPQLFEACAGILFEDAHVDGVLCVGLLGGYGLRFSDELAAVEQQAAGGMAQLAAKHGKALVVQSAYAPARPRAHALLRAAGVPVHASVEIAARCMAALWERGRLLASADARSCFAGGDPDPAAREHRALTEPAGRALLHAHGIPTGRWVLATDAEAAGRAVSALGSPVALKLVSPDIVHKSDVGGVLLDVATAADAHAGFERIVAAAHAAAPDAAVEGVLITPMAPPGVELLVGVATDATFGPVLTVGAGGTAVELLDDLAFRAIPVTALECHELLDELALAPLFDGYRGARSACRETVVALLRAVSELALARPDVVELDLNPVIVHAGGLELVDVRVVVSR